jgi:hypothetical protein
MRLPHVRFTALQLMLGVAAIALTFYFYTSIRWLESSIFLFRRAPGWLADVAELRAIGAHDVAEQRLIAASDDDRLAREMLWRAVPALALVGVSILYASTRLAARLIPALRSRYGCERPGAAARAGWSAVAVILSALGMASVARITGMRYPSGPRPVFVIKDGRLIEAGQAAAPVAAPDEPEALYLEPITAPSARRSGHLGPDETPP